MNLHFFTAPSLRLFHDADREIILLSFFDDDELAIRIRMRGDLCFHILHLDAIHADRAIFHIFSGLPLGLLYAAFDECFDDIDLLLMHFAALGIAESAFDFLAGELFDMAGEERLCDLLRLRKTRLAVDEAGDFLCELPLRVSMLRMLCDFGLERIDLLLREEGEILQVLHDVAVVLIEPELVEFIRRRLLRIQPYRAARRLAEFRAVRLQHQRDGETVGIVLVFHLADEVDTIRDIAPLVRAADLQLHIVFVIEHLEIDGLQDLVRKFREGNPRIKARCHDILGEHRIDVEKLAIVTKEVQQGNLRQPVIVIHHREAVITKEPLHLVRQTFRIVLDLLRRLEHTLRLAAGRIADGARAAADDDDRMMPRQLETLQDHERDQMPDVHAVPRRIDPAVEGNRFLSHQLV